MSALEPLPTGLAFQNGTAAADPSGPYIYSLQNGAIHGFQIVDSSGSLSELKTSPYLIQLGAGINGLAISGGASQAVSGAAAALAPPSLDFATITVGQSSATKIVELVNNWGTTAYRDIFFR